MSLINIMEIIRSKIKNKIENKDYNKVSNDFIHGFIFVFLILILHIMLDFNYIYFIFPKYSYTGFTLEINEWKLFESFLFTIIISLILPYKNKKPTDFLVVLLFLIAILPLLSIYPLMNNPREYFYMIILSFLVILYCRNMPLFKIKWVRINNKVIIFSIIILVIILFQWIIFRGGLKYFNLDISKVYNIRRKIGALISISIFSYLIIWFSKVFNITLIAWCLYKRKIIFAIFFIFLQVLFFGIVAHKAVIFYPLIILLLYFFKKKKYLNHYLLLSVLIIFIISDLFYVMADNMWPISIFIRRVFFVPAKICNIYYKIFSDIGFVYFSNSIFSSFIKYPFEFLPVHLASVYTYGEPKTWMNCGFLGASYMQCGFLGMILYSFIIAILFKLVDKLSVKFPNWFAISIVVIPFYSLFLSADLFTALLTHGLGISLILLWLLGGKIKNGEKYTK